MNQDHSLQSWPENVPDESIIPPSGDPDFSSILDLDFDLAEFEKAVGEHDRTITTSAMNVSAPMSSSGHVPSAMQTSQPQEFNPMNLDSHVHSVDMQGIGSMGTDVNSHFYPQKQAQQQQNVFPQQYNQGHPFIPPTPNSTELHGGVRHYPAPLDTGIPRRYEPYTRVTDDQSAYTPLISPAMTPLEQQLRFPEYATPGEYLSPLTSPALEAHNPSSNAFLFGATSGVDMGFVSTQSDMSHPLPSTAPPASPSSARRQRRKSSLNSRPRIARQSPLVRPTGHRQRHPPSSMAYSESSWSKSHDQATNRANNSQHCSSNESSGQDSVSPEPLSEPLMPPPALPSRTTRSPYISAQESSSDQKAREAATPATLMKLPMQSQSPSLNSQFSRNGTVMVDEASEEMMVDISLPEPATGMEDNANGADDQTPKLSAKRTPLLKSASDQSGANSVTPSPQLGAMKSPMGPVGLKRADSKQSGRTSKKRQSTNTAQASPALRPKISPSIKPMVRGEGPSTETSALYLASKSNYQHILEGTLLPGVSYPDTLAENLSSKRTNHKLAEQGRRNRINTALKEIEGLLPPSLSQDKGKEKGEPPNEGKANGTAKSPDKPSSNQPISKASTVEMAIVYIKALQEELAATKRKLQDAELKLNAKEIEPKPIVAGSTAETEKPVEQAKPPEAETKSSE